MSPSRWKRKRTRRISSLRGEGLPGPREGQSRGWLGWGRLRSEAPHGVTDSFPHTGEQEGQARQGQGGQAFRAVQQGRASLEVGSAPLNGPREEDGGVHSDSQKACEVGVSLGTASCQLPVTVTHFPEYEEERFTWAPGVRSVSPSWSLWPMDFGPAERQPVTGESFGGGCSLPTAKKQKKEGKRPRSHHPHLGHTPDDPRPPLGTTS